jgi:hypothetical protein
MNPDITRLEQAISALEAQRPALGDAVVDAALGPLRDKLSALRQPVDEPAGEDSQKRKTITVLFADIPDLAALNERYDPEDLRDATNALWEQLDSAILAHGGRIDKHMGHGVMALWGAESIAEDDPEQAIRAALGMRSILQEFRQNCRFFPAQASPAGGDQYRPGHCRPNGHHRRIYRHRRYRQPGGAPQPIGPGRANFDFAPDTYRLVRGIFDIEKLPAMRVKGKSEKLSLTAS